MFSRSEWEYLKRDTIFKAAIKALNTSKVETLDDVDALVLLGNRLLLKWEDANPRKPKFGRVKQTKKRKSASETIRQTDALSLSRLP